MSNQTHKGVLFNLFFISSIFLLQLAQSTNGLSVDEELTLTFPQKLALDKFKERVSPRLTQKHMKRDIYLIRWLRESKFNLEIAERKLIDTLEWRKQNNIDTINLEDWSKIGSDYPYSTEVHDREERPTFVFSFGDWDIRRAAVAGKAHKLVLYWAKAMEELTAQVRMLQSQGRNVTQVNLIIDVKGYNLVQHGCSQCMQVYTGLITLMKDRYPGDVNKAYIVNAPRMFEVLLQALRPVIGPTGESFKVFGTDKKEWKKSLLNDFSEDQLPYILGGTKSINELNY